VSKLIESDIPTLIMTRTSSKPKPHSHTELKQTLKIQPDHNKVFYVDGMYTISYFVGQKENYGVSCNKPLLFLVKHLT
jgi:hypothetical protein